MARGDPFGFGTNLLGQTVRPATDNRTFNGQDTFAVDCSSPSAEDGTEFSAEQANELVANLRSLLRVNGNTINDPTPVVTEDGGDTMLMLAVQHAIQRGLVGLGIDHGTVAGAMAVTLTPVPPELIDGMEIAVKPAFANTGPATLNLLGTNPVQASAGTPLAGGELQPAFWTSLRWNAGRGAWTISSPTTVKPTRLLTGSGALAMTIADKALFFQLSGAGSLNLPAPYDGYECAFHDLSDNFNANPLTLNAPGGTVFPGSLTSVVCDRNNQSARVVFCAGANLWKFIP